MKSQYMQMKPMTVKENLSQLLTQVEEELRRLDLQKKETLKEELSTSSFCVLQSLNQEINRLRKAEDILNDAFRDIEAIEKDAEKPAH